MPVKLIDKAKWDFWHLNKDYEDCKNYLQKANCCLVKEKAGGNERCRDSDAKMLSVL